MNKSKNLPNDQVSSRVTCVSQAFAVETLGLVKQWVPPRLIAKEQEHSYAL